jgi:para-aminobenzoate synthetase component I
MVTEAPAARAGLIVRPVAREIPAEVTPLRALRAVGRLPHTAFFESGGEVSDAARWTLLAFDPLWCLECREGALWRREVRSEAGSGGAGGGSAARGGWSRRPGPALHALGREWPPRVAWDVDEIGGEAPPFLAGVAGFVGYDFKDEIERFPRTARSESLLPDLSLGFYDVVWAWDRRSGRGWVVSSGLPDPDAAGREARARGRLGEQWARVTGSRAHADPDGAAPRDRSAPAILPVRSGAPTVRSNFTRDAYRRAVERALEHIAAGDVYQVNLAQRFRFGPTPQGGTAFRSSVAGEADAADPLALYLRLREESPAPFAAYLCHPRGAIVSSSPERFFRIRGREIETWPIKGTRPRGSTPEDDAAFAAALSTSGKDRAENVMIVDLERNDLGKVCEIGTVEVPTLCEVARYANVHHLVSRVRGILREDAGPADVWRALFPGGSITGAPKIRAVEIIDALEPVRRGVYTGAVGYWDAGGGCDYNIAIRTMVVEAGTVWFHAGGGIVADSTPEGEYEETLVKASAMLRASGFPGDA